MGQEAVREATTTHYTGTLDTAKLIASRQGLTPDDVKFLKKQLAAQGDTFTLHSVTGGDQAGTA